MNRTFNKIGFNILVQQKTTALKPLMRHNYTANNTLATPKYSHKQKKIKPIISTLQTLVTKISVLFQ